MPPESETNTTIATPPPVPAARTGDFNPATGMTGKLEALDVEADPEPSPEETRQPVRGAELGYPVVYSGENGDEAAVVSKVHDEYTGLVNLQVFHGGALNGCYHVLNALPLAEGVKGRGWHPLF